ncbi:MAG: ABC transporter permease [Planctomycetia bacterium]|nr:ABC transporter permease [Planctomycetia bacterium]
MTANLPEPDLRRQNLAIWRRVVEWALIADAVLVCGRLVLTGRPLRVAFAVALGGAVYLLCRRIFRPAADALGPLAALCLIALFFAAGEFFVNWRSDGRGFWEFARTFESRFWSPLNGRTILVQSSTVAVAALGMTLVIIAGGIDLSVGNAMALAAAVLAWRLNVGDGPTKAILAALVTGCFTGLVNGLLISRLKVVPFIVTLGTMMLYLGLAKIVTGESTLRPPLDSIPNWIPQLVSPQAPSPRWILLPTGAWVALVLSLILAVVLRFTVFGRHVFAVGSNESTARLCGINVPLVKVIVYTLAGLFAGIGGLYLFARASTANPTAGAGIELKVIAAVVIGGGSLSGGRGSVLGTLAGAGITWVIANGCTFLGLANPIQDIVIGVIIVAAVAIDRLRKTQSTAGEAAE